jgi:transmembrane sensor
MNSTPEPSDEIQRAASEWIVRLDRGLTASEQDSYSQWLASDPRHREAMTYMCWGWEELDRLAGLETTQLSEPDPDLFAPKRTVLQSKKILFFTALASTLAAAAMVAAGFYIKRSHHPLVEEAMVASNIEAETTAYERRLLDDGSVAELNRGTSISVEFTPAERHVRLVQGEANFTVAKNPARPFVVEASGVAVQAVGTVFNVRMEHGSVDVLVSEGTVKVAPSTLPAGAAPAREPLYIKAGQHALVSLASGGIRVDVSNISSEKIGQDLAWRTRTLDFDDAPLSEIVASFNAHNTVKLIIGDDSLKALRLSVTFRSDNVEGFLRLMDSDFDMRAERRGEHEIVLRKK